MEITKEQLDKACREIILQLRHDPGNPKGKTWCEGYHTGLADMATTLESKLFQEK